MHTDIIYFILLYITIHRHVSVAWVCGRSLVGIVGSNPTVGMDVCML